MKVIKDRNKDKDKEGEWFPTDEYRSYSKSREKIGDCTYRYNYDFRQKWTNGVEEMWVGVAINDLPPNVRSLVIIKELDWDSNRDIIPSIFIIYMWTILILLLFKDLI